MKQLGIRLFIALNASLCALLVWLWVGPDGKPRNLDWSVPAPVAPEFGDLVAALPEAKAMEVGLFMATLERPLFSPARRPAPPSPKESDTKEAPDPLANIHLFGIYTTDDGPSGMLVRVEGKVRRIAVNENLGGWTLKSVQERGATLTRNGEERVIHLAIARPAVPGKPPAAGQMAPPGGAASSAAAGSAAGTAEERRQQLEEANRERLRRRNELRAKAGAKPVSQ